MEIWLKYSFLAWFGLLAAIDWRTRLVDDRLVLAGLVPLLAARFWLGQGGESLLGLLAGLAVSGSFYLFGLAASGEAAGEEAVGEDPVMAETEATATAGWRQFGLPFLPALWLALAAWRWLPFGEPLAQLLPVWPWVLAGSCLLLALTGLGRAALSGSPRRFLAAARAGFGGGDVTAAALLGAFCGWRELLAVFWLAVVLHAAVGAAAFIAARLCAAGPAVQLRSGIRQERGDTNDDIETTSKHDRH